MPNSAEWLIFLGTAAVFAFTPGPGMLYVLARGLRGGRREGVLSAVGNAIGCSAHVLAAALGLSALLAASTTAFTVVRFAGAAYLVYLGVQAIRHRHDDGEPETTEGNARKLARSPLAQGILTELLNPKTALYFMALLPHFVHPGTTPAPVAFGLLGMIALVLAMIADLVVGVFAGNIAQRFLADRRRRIRQRVAGGAVMIGLGAFVASAD
ncbi:LysE family translocator [Amycolatopsis rhizosphaerae]|uniref:LysE family translocator n=1 Tax=Amycolatopsis rhizosphaerae TaxID=2053003 RepID=A0A558BTU9_9PSEU|nr:LysE family translocator [Amycolatopsis rhizosphaerae]TVT39944.1 LysE family translocator [Amycolatopsis rhizosphaerae]